MTKTIRMSSFNRTFMELKLQYRNWTKDFFTSVLIVPLWNWNRVVDDKNYPDEYVLIVPLWNWNYVQS